MTTAKRPPILAVDDEEDARVLMLMALPRDEYDVTVANSTEDALRKLAVLSFDVVITDIRLPGVDGIHLLRELQRRWPDTITIVLTAYPSLDTAVAALRAGAHDYLSKPCPPNEIRRSVQDGLAKLRGLTKRIELMHALEQQLLEGLEALREEKQANVSATAEPAPPPLVPLNLSQIVRAGSFIVDRTRHEALLGEMPLDLTPTEFEILAILAERAPAVISAQELTRRALNYAANEAEARDLIRWHIHHLRRKLEVDPDRPKILKNIRGIGYKLEVS
jgi:DNA-binding response OmpR family regulator